MMNQDPRHIRISDYNYPLPDERIAKFPLAERDQSKLLIYRHGQVSESQFFHLPELIEGGELMVFKQHPCQPGTSALPQGHRGPHRGVLSGAARAG